MVTNQEYPSTENSIHREFEFLEVLTEVSRVLGSALHTQDAYSEVVHQISRVLQFDRLTISRVDRDSRTHRLEHISGVDADSLTSRISVIDCPLEDQLLNHLVDVRAIEINPNDNEKGAEDFSRLLESGMRSLLSVPMIWRENLVGELSLYSVNADAFDDHQITLCQRIGTQMSSAMANANLSENLQLEHADTATLAEIARVIGSKPNFHEAFSEFAAVVQPLIPYDRVSFGMVKPFRDEIAGWIFVGTEIPGYGPGEETPIDPILASAIRLGRCLAFNAGEAYPEFGIWRYLDGGLTSKHKSHMIVPVIFDNQTVGLLSFRSTEKKSYGSRQLEFGSRVGRLIAGSIATAGLHEQLESEGNHRIALRRIERSFQTATSIAQLTLALTENLSVFIPVNDVQFLIADAESGCVVAALGYEVSRTKIVAKQIRDIRSLFTNEDISKVGELRLISTRIDTTPGDGATATENGVAYASTMRVAFTFPGSGLLGTLIVSCPENQSFSPEHVSYLEQAISLISESYRHMMLRKQLLIVDALSQVSDRLQIALVRTGTHSEISQSFGTEVSKLTNSSCLVIIGVSNLQIISDSDTVSAHIAEHSLASCNVRSVLSDFIDGYSSSPLIDPQASLVTAASSQLGVDGGTENVIVVPVIVENSLRGVVGLSFSIHDPDSLVTSMTMNAIAQVLATAWTVSDRYPKQIVTTGVTGLTVRAVVVHEHETCRAAIRALLDRSQVQIVSESDISAIQHLVSSSDPDVIIFRIHSADGEDCKLLRELTGLEGFPPVLVIGDSASRDDARLTFSAGAAGYVSAGLSPHLLAGAAVQVAHGGSVIDRDLTRDIGDDYSESGALRHDQAPDILGLDDRELDILMSIARGESNAEIAARLHLATGTVKNIVLRIYRTLDVSNRSEAAYIAGQARFGASIDQPL